MWKPHSRPPSANWGCRAAQGVLSQRPTRCGTPSRSEPCARARMAGMNITKHMVALSTYLGHGKVADTYWYLEAVPELMQAVADCARVEVLAT